MSHEAVLYGVIICPLLRGAADISKLQSHNEHIICSLPADDEHPWVDPSIFALPGPVPFGTFRRQVIHFGLTIKEDIYGAYTQDLGFAWLNSWINKFEAVLRQLYWSSARLIVESDFSPQRREFTWKPGDGALQHMYAEPHEPIAEWNRTMSVLEGEKLYGT